MAPGELAVFVPIWLRPIIASPMVAREYSRLLFFPRSRNGRASPLRSTPGNPPGSGPMTRQQGSPTAETGSWHAEGPTCMPGGG